MLEFLLLLEYDYLDYSDFIDRLLAEVLQVQMKIKPSELADNFTPKSSKQHRSNRLTWILSFAFLVIVPTTGYLLWREIQLRTVQKLIPYCFKYQKCADNIEVLEKLVKAKKSLKLLNLPNGHLENAHLESAHLPSANLENTHLENAHLENSHLENANLATSHLENAHLENAHLENVNLSNAHLEGANLQGADLRGAYVSHDHLQGARLNRANLQGVHLYHTDFKQANFQGANLSQTYFYRANFDQSNLYGANLHGAHLIEAQNLTPAQIKSACNWSTAIYKGVWSSRRSKWVIDRAANQQFIQKLKQDKDSDLKKPVDCSEWK